jgi:hypothetical protein
MNNQEELLHPIPSSEGLSDADLQKMNERLQQETAERVAQMIINSSTNEVDPLGR